MTRKPRTAMIAETRAKLIGAGAMRSARWLCGCFDG